MNFSSPATDDDATGWLASGLQIIHSHSLSFHAEGGISAALFRSTELSWHEQMRTWWNMWATRSIGKMQVARQRGHTNDGEWILSHKQACKSWTAQQFPHSPNDFGPVFVPFSLFFSQTVLVLSLRQLLPVIRVVHSDGYASILCLSFLSVIQTFCPIISLIIIKKLCFFLLPIVESAWRGEEKKNRFTKERKKECFVWPRKLNCNDGEGW